MLNPSLALFAVAFAVSGTTLAKVDFLAATSTGGISVDNCIYVCISQAASDADCSGLDDYECICGSSKYQDSANSCLQQCTDADADWGRTWYQDTCEYEAALDDIVSDYSTFTAAVATISVSDSAQLSSLQVKASTFAAHLSSEYSVATASYSSAYSVLGSSASALLVAASETAVSTTPASSATIAHTTSVFMFPSNPHTTSGVVSTASTSIVTQTPNAASGLQAMMHSGVVAATVVLSLFLGSSLALV